MSVNKGLTGDQHVRQAASDSAWRSVTICMLLFKYTNIETEVAFASKLISYSVTCNLNT